MGMGSEDFRSVGIVGTGWVGSSVTISTLHLGIANELLLFGARPNLADGEAIGLVTASLAGYISAAKDVSSRCPVYGPKETCRA